MSVQNAQLLDGCTIAATGGTAKQYGPSGQKITNGVQIVDQTVSDVTVRPFVNLVSQPTVFDRKSKTWSPDKRTMTVVHPFVDASLVQHFPSIEIKVNYVVGMTDAQKDALDSRATQMMIDADFTAFRRTGSLS